MNRVVSRGSVLIAAAVLAACAAKREEKEASAQQVGAPPPVEAKSVDKVAAGRTRETVTYIDLQRPAAPAFAPPAEIAIEMDAAVSAPAATATQEMRMASRNVAQPAPMLANPN